MAKKLDPEERWKRLRKIAEDDDTCEMGPDIRITRVYKGSGQKDALWLVGGKAKSAKRKPRR
jgi:hypothetical protein